MARIKIDKELYERLQDCSVVAGYSSVDEFVIHVLEREVNTLEEAEDDPEIMTRLKGLGYIA